MTVKTWFVEEEKNDSVSGYKWHTYRALTEGEYLRYLVGKAREQASKQETPNFRLAEPNTL